MMRSVLVMISTAVLIAAALSCGRDPEVSNGCSDPGADEVVGTTEECVRQVYFADCPLNLPGPPYDSVALFDVDGEGVINVSYKPSSGAQSPFDLVVILRHPTEESGPGGFSVDVGDSKEIVIDGTIVVLGGADDARGAAWQTNCVDYNLSVVATGMTQDELDAVLIDSVTESLR